MYYLCKNKTTGMKIEKLNGTNKRLYQLIAPLAMNSTVVKQNGGVPITTSGSHTWYVAIEKKKVVGFLSLVGGSIRHDYHNDAKVFDQLLRNLMSDNPGLTLRYVSSSSEMPIVEQLGFVVEKTSKNYFYVKYEQKKGL